MSKPMIPIVLSGGMGTRLWPLSRATFPKQFCELLDESLLEKTLKRVRAFGSPWTLTVAELQTLTGRVFRDLGLPEEQIVYEPFGRNTAPAIALVCRILELQNRSDEIVGVFPADHLILNDEAFAQAVGLAQQCAEQSAVVTLGIKPEYAATGFGYIEVSANEVATAAAKPGSSTKQLNAFSVKSFREKPDEVTAEGFIKAGTFFWNAGIFIFKVSRMCECFAEFAPDTWKKLQALKADLSNLKEIYATLDSISIDYAIIEKLRTALVCIPCDIGWSDLGSWDDVARFSEPPFSMTFANQAEVVKADTENTFVFSMTEKTYGLIGVSDLIVVDTPDALLITKKGMSQEVRKVTDQLTKRGNITAREHRFERRPWGSYQILREEPYYKSKLIIVDPGAQISYQYHHKRNEHWIIVQGAGEVTLDDQTRAIGAGESVFVTAGTKHRIRNTGSQPLEFVEVQTGTYFGEDDIIRIQDDYNRK